MRSSIVVLTLFSALVAISLVSANDQFAGTKNIYQCDNEDYSMFSKFKDLISKYGPKALEWLKCMGAEFVENCAPQTLQCLTHRNPDECLSALECEGKNGIDCAHKLKLID